MTVRSTELDKTQKPRIETKKDMTILLEWGTMKKSFDGDPFKFIDGMYVIKQQVVEIKGVVDDEAMVQHIWKEMSRHRDIKKGIHCRVYKYENNKKGDFMVFA